LSIKNPTDTSVSVGVISAEIVQAVVSRRELANSIANALNLPVYIIAMQEGIHRSNDTRENRRC
jgi:hypothetical protein